MAKIDEEKLAVQKQRGGIDQEVINEWHDIDRQREKASLKYKLKQFYAWIIKHKIGTIISSLIIISLAILGFAFAYVIHGDVNVIGGGEDIIPESVDISENKGSWNITLRNDGWKPSNDVVLFVKFDDRVRINENTIVYVPIPDDEMLDDDKNELKYTWNILGSGKEIIVTFGVTTPNSNIITNKTPIYVQVKTEEEGLVYFYPPIDG